MPIPKARGEHERRKRELHDGTMADVVESHMVREAKRQGFKVETYEFEGHGPDVASGKDAKEEREKRYTKNKEEQKKLDKKLEAQSRNQDVVGIILIGHGTGTGMRIPRTGRGWTFQARHCSKFRRKLKFLIAIICDGFPNADQIAEEVVKTPGLVSYPTPKDKGKRSKQEKEGKVFGGTMKDKAVKTLKKAGSEAGKAPRGRKQ